MLCQWCDLPLKQGYLGYHSACVRERNAALREYAAAACQNADEIREAATVTLEVIRTLGRTETAIDSRPAALPSEALDEGREAIAASRNLRCAVILQRELRQRRARIRLSAS